MIYDTNTVSSRNIGSFTSSLNSIIENYQGQGLTVEVQYSTAKSGNFEVVYSALIIARKAAE